LHIRTFQAEDIEANMDALAGIMQACVNDGASIGYVLPFGRHDGEAFWRQKVLPAVADGGRLLLVALAGDGIAGTVQLDHDTPPNQSHRAEVRKLLVHPAFRRQGIARALMAALETHARRLGRSLLTLDTRTGDSAEPLYASLGYRTTGIIPGYCRDTATARLDSTTIMYKHLDSGIPPAGGLG
jgi:ribosomal protein S18 acetylase RimI-like enzyme